MLNIPPFFILNYVIPLTKMSWWIPLSSQCSVLLNKAARLFISVRRTSTLGFCGKPTTDFEHFIWGNCHYHIDKSIM